MIANIVQLFIERKSRYLQRNMVTLRSNYQPIFRKFSTNLSEYRLRAATEKIHTSKILLSVLCMSLPRGQEAVIQIVHGKIWRLP